MSLFSNDPHNLGCPMRGGAMGSACTCRPMLGGSLGQHAPQPTDDLSRCCAERDALTVENDVLRNALRTMLGLLERLGIEEDGWGELDEAMAEARRLVG